MAGIRLEQDRVTRVPDLAGQIFAVDLVLEISEDEPETQTDREYRLPGAPRPAGGENG